MYSQQPPSSPKQVKAATDSGHKILGCFGVVWTAITLFIGMGAIASGGWFVLLFLIPFLAIGIGILSYAFAPTLRAMKITPPEVHLSTDIARLGETVAFSYFQQVKKPVQVDRISVRLIRRESASYTRGTDRVTDTDEQILGTVEKPPRLYRDGEAISLNETFTVPHDGMHTFNGNNNKIQYLIKVEVLIAKWPDVKEEYAIFVVPERLKGTGGENR
jgi:hypothetical protein